MGQARDTYPLPLSLITRRVVMPRARNQVTARSKQAALVSPRWSVSPST